MHLYMIRHGQSYVNLPSPVYRNADEGLTPLGQKQAAALADWLPTIVPSVDAIYCSTMQRARETADPIAQTYQQDIHFEDHLREIGTTRFDHIPFPADALPNFSDYWASERPFTSVTPEVDNGESFMNFRTRVGIAIEKLVRTHRDQTVLLIAHGGVIEVSFDHIFNIGPWRRCEVWVHNTAITHFEYVAHPTRETWRLHFHNRVEHLIGL